MAQTPTRNTFAGGFPIAIGAIGGAVIGLYKGQPSAWLLGGFGAGVAVAVVIWLVGRRGA